MLFLYRPRQTYMPFSSPRSATQQGQYNRQLQQKFAASRRVAPAPPITADRDRAADLNALDHLHRSGALTDAEYAAARARVAGR